MKILAALDDRSYSAGIINIIATLAANTWADVTLLGTISSGKKREAMSPDHPLVQKMLEYKDIFLNGMPESASPYSPEEKTSFSERGGQLLECTCTSQESRKTLKIHIRQGNPEKEILVEALEEESDLLILGCSGGEDCQWEGELNLPEKIAKVAPCSVLVIKEDRVPDKIICCLDQASVSQESLEMINQVVTFYGTGLEINGLTGAKGLKEDVEKQMDEILKYYTSREIDAWIKLVDTNALEDYVSRASGEGMIALWMGKKSLLKKLFSRDVVDRLVNHARSSALILR